MSQEDIEAVMTANLSQYYLDFEDVTEGLPPGCTPDPLCRKDFSSTVRWYDTEFDVVDGLGDGSAIHMTGENEARIAVESGPIFTSNYGQHGYSLTGSFRPTARPDCLVALRFSCDHRRYCNHRGIRDRR